MLEAQYYEHEEPNTLLTSGGLGTMGYSLPASIGASFTTQNKDIWVIDVGQAVTNQHPNAEEFLIRDVTRLVEWINRKGFEINLTDCLVRVLDEPVPKLKPLPGGD